MRRKGREGGSQGGGGRANKLEEGRKEGRKERILLKFLISIFITHRCPREEEKGKKKGEEVHVNITRGWKSYLPNFLLPTCSRAWGGEGFFFLAKEEEGNGHVFRSFGPSPPVVIIIIIIITMPSSLRNQRMCPRPQPAATAHHLSGFPDLFLRAWRLMKQIRWPVDVASSSLPFLLIWCQDGLSPPPPLPLSLTKQGPFPFSFPFLLSRDRLISAK